MVLRDKRDKGKKLPLSNRWDEMKYGYDRPSRNKRLRRMHSKKNRIKFKKYTNNVVVFNSKQKHIKKEQIKKQNINGRIVKVIISHDEMVKKDAPICIRHSPDAESPLPSIAYTNKEGQSLPYEYNVVNV